MSNPLLVAVTGATGFVGRSVVRELLSRGCRVRALVRDAADARRILPASVELVVGGIHDGRSPQELVKGADACIHLIGIIREVRGEKTGDGPVTFQRMHVDATKAVVEACVNAGVKRYLHMSSLGAKPDGKAEYERTKFQAEVLVRRSGLDWTIFRPSLIHGPDGELVHMVHDMAAGHAAPWYFMPYFAREITDMSVPLGPSRLESALIQPIAVQDVAWAFAEALQRPVSVGEIYNLVGPDRITWPEMMGYYRDNLPGTIPGMPIAPVPGAIAAIAAMGAAAVGLGGLLPFDAGQALMAMEDSVSEMSKTRTDLGLSPRPFRQAASRYAAQMAH